MKKNSDWSLWIYFLDEDLVDALEAVLLLTVSLLILDVPDSSEPVPLPPNLNVLGKSLYNFEKKNKLLSQWHVNKWLKNIDTVNSK